MKAAERMRPILENWIQSKEEETGGGGNKYQKKRRKRTSFSPEYVQLLNECFQKNPKPNLEEMQEIANKINLDLTTVKVWFCNKKQTMKRLGQPLYRSNSKVMKQELVTVDGKQVKRKPDSPQQQQGIFALNTAGGMKPIIPASTPTGTVTMPFFISQDGNPIPIVSGATISNNNNQVVQPSTTLAQQIVHLSQVPILTSMVVNNNALQQQQQQGSNDNTNDNNTEGNTTAQATQLISAGGRIISSGSVLQLPGGALQAVQQQAIQQAQQQQQHLNQSQNNGSLTNSTAAAVMMAAANAATGGIQQQQAASLVNTTSDGRSNATETIILNKRQQQLLQQHQEASIKGAHLKMSEKDLESDEVCVSDDTGSSSNNKSGPKLVARASPNPS